MAWYDDDQEGVTAKVVHEDDGDRFTGLYDAQGRPLMRERRLMGFRVEPRAKSARHPVKRRLS